MPNARSFVIMYSVVLMVLFISFLYLMTTIDPHITPPTYVSSTVPTITTKKTITTTVTTTTVGDNEDDKKNFKARGGIHSNVSTYKFKHPVNIKGHRRKENIIERIMQTIPGKTIVQPLSTTETIVSRDTISPTPYNVLTTETNAETVGQPVKHDLSELGDKMQRILPPVHPAVKGFRRSVDNVNFRLSDKNEILLKIVDNEGVPRIEIKLRATNGHSKQHNISVIKLNNKTNNEKLNFYIQEDNETALNDLPFEPSNSSDYIDDDYKTMATSVSVLKGNDYLYSEATLNTNGLPHNELRNSFLTSDGDTSTFFHDHTTYNIQQKFNIDSTELVDNLTKLTNEETDPIKTVTIKSFYTLNNNLTQISCTNVTATPPEVSNTNQLIENVDKYRKIYSHSFYQRDKSEPDVAEDVSQVKSDFLLHFLPLTVPHDLPHSVNIKSFSNDSVNENFETNFENYKKLLKSSPIMDKIITVSGMNTKTSLPYSEYELKNNIKLNHPKIRNTADEKDITTGFENIIRDSTTTTDALKITFLRKDLSEILTRFSTPNMTTVKVTPLLINLHDPRNWSFSNNDEIKYNVTRTVSKPTVEKDLNVNVNVGFPKGDNSSTLSKQSKNSYVEGVVGIKTIERQSKNFNMLNNKVSTNSNFHFINGTTLNTNNIHTKWLEYKSKENKTLRKLERRHFYETPAVKPIITISYRNTTTVSNYFYVTNPLETEIYPIL